MFCFAGANQNIENKEKKKPFQVAKPGVVEALRKLLSNKRGGWKIKRGGWNKRGLGNLSPNLVHKMNREGGKIQEMNKQGGWNFCAEGGQNHQKQ